MFDICQDLYNKELLSIEDIRDVVLYSPMFGLTKIDYETITGQPWNTVTP
ncbi:hypothetical protein [Weissella minor]|nr:hypothetical protein [Weissella minor]